MNKMLGVVDNDVMLRYILLFAAAHHLPDSPVGIIAGSAVAVVLCMLIVIIMVVIFLRRSVLTVLVLSGVNLSGILRGPKGRIQKAGLV